MRPSEPGPGTASELARGRDAFRRKAWREASERLAAADEQDALEPEDLERLATAHYLAGRHAESEECWSRAHRELVRRGEVERAARCAFWLAFGLAAKGERARASAWIARAGKILDEAGSVCVERGYLLLRAAFERLMEGDASAALSGFRRAAEIGERFVDPDLMALALHSQGRVLLRMGDVREGVAKLDEAMIAVETDELSPLVIGDVYCSVIEGCMEIFDVRRAQEWTEALSRWCDAQPDLVPYSGQCLVRRAELLQLRGRWADAVDAAHRACERFLRGPDQPAAGSAFYQRAELHRLRGELEEAEAAYHEASRWGRSPQPGLALLRLAQGKGKAARTAIRRALAEAGPPSTRSRLLPAQVEIALDAKDLASARAAVEELSRLAADVGAELLRAEAAKARGALLLAEGQGARALAELRRAWTVWQEVDSPYEAARARVLIGITCRMLGDQEAAVLELEAARAVFEGLSARTDLARVRDLARRESQPLPERLTRRELQVLRLVASGKSNRAIAVELSISERTVERHVSNILAKLDVPSRAAATAYAYEHELL